MINVFIVIQFRVLHKVGYIYTLCTISIAQEWIQQVLIYVYCLFVFLFKLKCPMLAVLKIYLYRPMNILRLKAVTAILPIANYSFFCVFLF